MTEFGDDGVQQPAPGAHPAGVPPPAPPQYPGAPQPGQAQPPAQPAGGYPPPQPAGGFPPPQPGQAQPPPQPAGGYPPPQGQPPQMQPPAQQPPHQPTQGYAPGEFGGAPVGGAPPAAPGKKSRRGLWIFLGIIGVLILGVGGCIALLFNEAQGATEAAEDFMDSVAANDFDAAFNAFSPSCRNFTVAELEEVFGGATVTEYDLSLRGAAINNGDRSAQVSGTIQTGGRAIEIEFSLNQENDEWLLCRVDVGGGP